MHDGKLYRMIVRRECEVTDSGKVTDRKIVPAYAYIAKGRVFLTTSERVARKIVCIPAR